MNEKKRKKAISRIIVYQKKAFEFLLLLFFSAFPLAVWHNYNNITEVKLCVFCGLSILTLITELYFYLGLKLEGYNRPKPNTHFNITNAFLIIYLAINLLSFILSPYKELLNDSGKPAFLFGSGRYDGYILLLLYALVFLVFSKFSAFNKSHVVLCGTVTFIIAVIGIIQRFGINIFYLYPRESFTGRWNNFISTIGNSDIYSCLICIFVPIIITSYILLDFNRIHSCIFLSSTAFSVFLICTSKSSAGISSILLTFLVVLPLLQKTFKNLKKSINGIISVLSGISFNSMLKIKYLKSENKYQVKLYFDTLAIVIIAFIIVLLITRLIIAKQEDNRSLNKKFAMHLYGSELLFSAFVLIWIYWFYKPTEGINRDLLSEIYDIIHGKISDTTGTYRIGIWKRSIEAGKEHLLFGTGMGSFIKVFYETPENEFTLIKDALLDNAHNEYIQNFIASGLVGLTAYLGFIVSAFISVFKQKNDYTVILGTAVFCYCIQAFFNFSIVITAPFFWLCIALMCGSIKTKYCET